MSSSAQRFKRESAAAFGLRTPAESFKSSRSHSPSLKAEIAIDLTSDGLEEAPPLLSTHDLYTAEDTIVVSQYQHTRTSQPGKSGEIYKS